MWLLKFKNWHKNCVIRPRCVKFQVTDFVFLINSWHEKKKFYYTELHILQGTEENKKKFIKDLKKEKEIIRLEQVGNHIFTLNKKTIGRSLSYAYSTAFDPRLIYVKPVVQRVDGFEEWEMACWDKEPLMKIMKIPTFEIELVSIENVKLTDIFIPSIYPSLSPKQREAIELAVKQGYYNYPRKIDLEKLAKIAKVKRQTFQENLRRAEKKLVPFLTENLK